MTQFASADESAVAKAQRELEAAGVRTVIGTVVNASGITLAKSVPLARLKAFHQSGMGAAPVWHVFTIDGGIAFTDSITTVGDMRLKIDIAGLRVLQGGRAWAPASLFKQDGAASPACARNILASVDGRLDEAGYQALVGHELEFFLVAPDGSALETAPWVPYGATGLLDRTEFLDDLLSVLNHAGVPVEQIHAEYGRNQFEAHTFENVYIDVGLAVNFTGARSQDLVARSFELAPFTKILYSSDALGPAELHYLGARLWRNAITKVVGGWIDGDDCSEADARKIVQLVAHDNARRVYALP